MRTDRPARPVAAGASLYRPPNTTRTERQSRRRASTDRDEATAITVCDQSFHKPPAASHPTRHRINRSPSRRRARRAAVTASCPFGDEAAATGLLLRPSRTLGLRRSIRKIRRPPDWSLPRQCLRRHPSRRSAGPTAVPTLPPARKAVPARPQARCLRRREWRGSRQPAGSAAAGQAVRWRVPGRSPIDQAVQLRLVAAWVWSSWAGAVIPSRAEPQRGSTLSDDEGSDVDM